MSATYQQFLESKERTVKPSGFQIDRNNLPSQMFEFQKDIVKWACMKGKAAIFALTGMGKCHGFDTPIIMSDGSTKMVQDIQVGEKLMSVNSEHRTVLSITEGFASMFRVTPIKGESFTCNADHILRLQHTTTKECIEISVKDYLEKKKGFKHVYKLYRTSYELIEKELPCDPYIFGLWLANGTKSLPEITSHKEDIEPWQYITEWATNNNLVINTKKDLRDTQAITRSIVKPNWNSHQKNLFGEFLKNTIVNEEKTIPLIFLQSSIKQRLDLLAGLLDGDGYLFDKGFEIVNKYKNLANQIALLARSVGLGVTTKTVTKGIKSSGFTAQYYKTQIYGNTDIIPTKIPRKQAKPRKQKKDALVTGFNIEKIGNNFYYGFTLDGNGLYLLGDTTVTHNTLMQLTWANEVCKHTNQNVLILAPLGVAPQTVREGKNFGINVKLISEQSEVQKGINITNYEKLHKFNVNSFVGIVLDESSIIKDHMGKTTNQILDLFIRIPYKLSCTATPSPNDYTELGTQAEFLGIMTRTEMFAMFFVHDGGNVSQWRLKGHAEEEFWKWVCSWACFVTSPADLGYDASGYDLPPLNIHEIVIDVECKDMLFAVGKLTLEQRRNAKKDSIDERIAACAELVNKSQETFLIWCKLNEEGDKLEKVIKNSIQIAGKNTNEYKEENILAFAENKIPRLITKPEIFGHGLNLQNCSNMVFVGLGDSFEQYFQSIRRCYRFGQTKPVNVYVITSSAEGAIVDNIKRKEKDFNKMAQEMTVHTKTYVQENLQHSSNQKTTYKTDTIETSNFKLMLGDCIQRIKEIPDNSIDFSIFSPPFSSLYTYSNLIEDMGNCKGKNQFYQHFKFLVKELMRIVKPGRLIAVHCMNLQRLKERDGDMGIEDFRGDLIRLFLDDEAAELYNAIDRLKERAENAKKEGDALREINLLKSIGLIEDELKTYSNKKGFIFHSEIGIWKDPVVAMQRTKSLKLLWKQLKKDSSRSAQGLADHIIVFVKPGDNANPISHLAEDFPVKKWQEYASPFWLDINPSKTLQKESAREEKDERHIAPLQLQVIERCLELWSNPGDLVLDPFGGIGSTGFQALKMKRRAYLIELKESYYKQMVLNCQRAEIESQSKSLLNLLGDDQGETFGINEDENIKTEKDINNELHYGDYQ